MHAENVHASTPGGVAAPGARATLARVLRRAGIDTLYLTIGLATSIVAFGVAVTGVIASVTTAAFIIGLPVILLSAIAFRWVADLDRRNAALVLGRQLRGRYHDKRGQRFLQRLSTTLRDGQTWRDLAWLAIHSVLGFGFGCAAVAAVAEVIGTALLPAWYWALPDGANWGIWKVDSLGEAFLAAPVAIPLGAIAVALLRGMALGHAKLAEALLDAHGEAAAPTDSAAPAPLRRRPRPDGGAVLALQLALTALFGFTVTLIWGLTGGDYFWPVWV
jgi:Putative sensor